MFIEITIKLVGISIIYFFMKKHANNMLRNINNMVKNMAIIEFRNCLLV